MNDLYCKHCNTIIEFLDDLDENEEIYYCPKCKAEYIYDTAEKELYENIAEK